MELASMTCIDPDPDRIRIQIRIRVRIWIRIRIRIHLDGFGLVYNLNILADMYRMLAYILQNMSKYVANHL